MNVAGHRLAPDRLRRRYAGILRQVPCYDAINAAKAGQVSYTICG